MDFFGLDIGSYAIRIVKASRKGGAFLLDNFAEVKNPLPVINWSDTSHQQVLIETIRQCLSQSRVKTKNVSLCLKENQAHTKIVLFPHIPDKELAKAITYEAEQFIPVPLDDVQLEYQILREPPRGSLVEKMEVMVVAAQKKAIRDLLQIIGKAGLKPVNIETEMLAVARHFTDDKAHTSIVISLGHTDSHLLLLEKGQIRFMHGLSAAGSSLTKAISTHLSMDQNQAEQYKIAYGMDRSIMDGRVAAILEPVVDLFVKELRQTLEYIKKTYPQLSVSRIILCGGTAELSGFSGYLAQKLNIEIDILDPFNRFNKASAFPKELEAHRASYATVVGLAVKEI